MDRIKACFVIATLFVAGCAGSPEVAEKTAAAAPIAGSAAAVTATGATATPAIATPANAATATTAAVVPDAVIGIDELNASTGAPLICREMLKPNHNVHVRRCMTEADWEVYKRAEARRAEEQTRMMQGFIYHH